MNTLENSTLIMSKAILSPDKIMRTIENIKNDIRSDALKEGFDAVGFVSAKALPLQAERLSDFIKSDFHGEMTWLADTKTKRASPDSMWGEARSAIVLGMNYAPPHDPMDDLKAKDCGNISVYARGRDYHTIIKGKVKQIASRIASREAVQVKVFVDTAPLMEKPLAAQAGIGWQGKHTNLVSKEFGSWLFLGVILTDADWAEPPNENDHCGTCTACLDICPTKAFPAPYRLDARRCISYLTIEHKGAIDHEFRHAIGNRIFGCDDCLAVCPWNRFAKTAQEIKLKAMPKMVLPSLADLLAFDEAEFRRYFAQTAVRRAGFSGFQRNVLIAAGNSGEKGLIDAVMVKLNCEDPIVRGAAIWALGELMTKKDFASLREKNLASEQDEYLLSEWNNAGH